VERSRRSSATRRQSSAKYDAEFSDSDRKVVLLLLLMMMMVVKLLLLTVILM